MSASTRLTRRTATVLAALLIALAALPTIASARPIYDGPGYQAPGAPGDLDTRRDRRPHRRQRGVLPRTADRARRRRPDHRDRRQRLHDRPHRPAPPTAPQPAPDTQGPSAPRPAHKRVSVIAPDNTPHTHKGGAAALRACCCTWQQTILS